MTNQQIIDKLQKLLSMDMQTFLKEHPQFKVDYECDYQVFEVKLSPTILVTLEFVHSQVRFWSVKNTEFPF
jgi:hypothetical protein